MSQLQFVYDRDLPPTEPYRLQYLLDQVQRLSEIPQEVQKSEEWLRKRNSMITASDIGSVLGNSPYKDREEVLMSKVEPVFKKFGGKAIDHGVKYEPVANMIYEKRNQCHVLEFGCIRHHTFDFVGASPDGICRETGVMIEIKVPSSREITGVVPPYYYAQIQFQLHTCLLDRCDFLECNIVEYSEREYIEDNDNGNYGYHENGNEKGVVAVFIHRQDSTKFFEYSPLGIHGEEYEEWKRNIIQKYENHPYYYFYKFTPWYLEQVSCVPVYSNHEWFYSVIPSVRAFWDDVIKYRELGAEECRKYIKECRLRRKEEKELKKRMDEEENISKKTTKSKTTKANDKKISEYMISLRDDDDNEINRESVGMNQDENESEFENNVLNKTPSTDFINTKTKTVKKKKETIMEDNDENRYENETISNKVYMFSDEMEEECKEEMKEEIREEQMIETVPLSPPPLKKKKSTTKKENAIYLFSD